MLHHLAGATIQVANIVKHIIAIHLRMAKKGGAESLEACTCLNSKTGSF